MSSKTKTFTPNQISRLPDVGYWLEYYISDPRPTAYCIMNGQVKYIHYSWGTQWGTLMWTCCVTKKQIANPESYILRFEYFKTHNDMITAHPELDAAYQTKSPNDF